MITRAYDQAGRMTTIKATKGATNLQDRAYAYYSDPAAGESALQSRAIDNLSGRTTRYQYDDANRVFQARTYTTTGSVPSLLDSCTANGALACYQYTLDAASNRTAKTVTGSTIPNSTTTYAYNDANQLASRVSAGQTTSYTYDANGNQLTRPFGGSPRAMTYNVRDQATNINATSIGYLGAGQDQAVSEGSTTLQNNLLGLDARVIGATTDYYTRAADGTPLSQRTGSARQYYLLDSLGSITGTTNTSGTMQATYAYDPDGNTTGTTGSSTNPFGYAAGYQAPSGLMHFGQRRYDPDQARWTQQDPLNQAADLQEGNRYAYTGADPINNVDRGGLLISEALDYIGNKLGAGERYIFSDKLINRSYLGKGLKAGARVGSVYGAVNYANQCANRLTGGGLEGHNNGSCNPTQLVFP